ncbi:galactose-1-phosphate uridylyltransferase [Kitasatospora cineracea]|uniref:galactose-1-phosphate uridylyltransferase n=1 Tax=Kitasatospora cineracea TaxID=88074 RepID=UPI0033CFB6FE
MIRPAPVPAVLADGRTIHFYDDEQRHRPVPPDRRVLPPAGPPSELRWDATTEEWVIMAPHRAARAGGAGPGCALCPTTGGAATEVPAASYDVAVFENRYPALRGPGGPAPGAVPGPHAGAPAGGRCEVVSFSCAHDTSLARLPLRRMTTVVEAWADRTRRLNGLPGVEQVVCFENRGAELGATQAHPHGQIYAYPFVPARFGRMWEAAGRARGQGRPCPFCEVLAAEERAGERVVLRTPHWTAFVPYAARWPYEVHVYARRHTADLGGLGPEERADLARTYREVLRRFEHVEEAPLPYLALWCQAPAREGREAAHLHARIFSDRSRATGVKRLGAGELGAGAFVSEARPEEAAERLRAAAPAEES